MMVRGLHDRSEQPKSGPMVRQSWCDLYLKRPPPLSEGMRGSSVRQLSLHCSVEHLSLQLEKTLHFAEPGQLALEVV